MIKLASQKLFAFNKAELGYTTMNGIRQEAAFVFAQLTSLCIKEETDILVIKKIIENFQKYGKLEFIALEFSSWFSPNLHELGRETLAQINSLKFDSFGIEFNELTFLCGGEMGANGRLVPGTTAWPALTELVFNDCNMYNIDMQYLADFFPQLENLNITPIRHRYFPKILTDHPFRTMNNIRVLKLDNVSIAGFGMLGVDCLPHLEKLFLRVELLDSTNRIDSFPHFPKLTELILHLDERIRFSPTAFDHLTQLTRFEISNIKLDFYNNSHPLEMGVVARFMSFHLESERLKLNSNSVSEIEEIELHHNYKYEYSDSETRLEIHLPLSGLKRLTTSNCANLGLPFYQMTNLEFLKLKTSDLSIISTGQLKCLDKLRVLEISPGKIREIGQFRYKELCTYF
jgi:hypothetical protein